MKQQVALKIPSQHLLLTLDGLLIQLIHLACQKKEPVLASMAQNAQFLGLSLREYHPTWLFFGTVLPV
jgi:hypothetical protein